MISATSFWLYRGQELYNYYRKNEPGEIEELFTDVEQLGLFDGVCCTKDYLEHWISISAVFSETLELGNECYLQPGGDMDCYVRWIKGEIERKEYYLAWQGPLYAASKKLDSGVAEALRRIPGEIVALKTQLPESGTKYPVRKLH